VILVDTSVLIDFLEETGTRRTERLARAIEAGVPYGITSIVYQEVLQGAATAADFERLREYLETQKFYELTRGRASYEAAARIYFDCRRAGWTVSSAADCLIAQTALEHGLALLHSDKDFERIKKVRSKLRFW
jgi:predicted nucleic acid-binding protein